MGLIDIVTLPARFTVAATQATLGLGHLMAPEGPVRREGGYAERIMLVIGEGGPIERLAAVLADPSGPMSLVNALAAATSEDRPLGRAIAADGTLDRLLADDGSLERLMAAGGALDRVTQEGGVLDRLLREDGLLDRLLTEDGFLEKLVADGGTLDQLIALGATLEAIQPRLTELSRLIPDLHDSVNTLGRAVEPHGDLAGRLPRSRRRSALDA